MKSGACFVFDLPGLAVSLGLVHCALTAPKLTLVHEFRPRAIAPHEAVLYPAAKMVAVACALLGHAPGRSRKASRVVATAATSYVEFVNASIDPTAWNQRTGALMHGLVWAASANPAERNDLLGWLLATSSAQSMVSKMLATKGHWASSWTVAGALAELGPTRWLRSVAHRRGLTVRGAVFVLFMEVVPLFFYPSARWRGSAMASVALLHGLLWVGLNISFFHRVILAIALFCDSRSR